MIPPERPDLFRRLKPLYGKRIDALWLEYQTADMDRRREIEGILTLLAAKRLGMAVGEERLVLEPPPANLIGRGEYAVGSVSYPGMMPYEFRLGRNDLLRHTFILGPSGTGKSTLILGLLQQILADGVPFMCFDFKRNYRCLLTAAGGQQLSVVTVGRNTAPLSLNVLQPPEGVGIEEWIAGLADIISTSYLLMQGARNVLIEALLRAHRERGTDATLADAFGILDGELRATRAGSRRYGWLESSARSLEALSKGAYGKTLSAKNPRAFAELLGQPVVFELQGLGDDQKTFFCLLLLHAILHLRKNSTAQREVLQHVLVFDEAHNIFPKEQYGELGIPSRLTREVREYGEAIIAATQQADVAESLIANSGIKLILRCDFPRDVEFASRLLQIEPKWLPKLALGTGIARLPTRFYTPFLFTFQPQPIKNRPVTDDAVHERYLALGGRTTTPEPEKPPPTITEQETALLRDIAACPIAGITARYERLGWHPRPGNQIKDTIITRGLAYFEDVPTGTGRIKILTLTPVGVAHLQALGVAIMPGRGSAAHEYWRATIRNILGQRGYTTQAEYAVLGGAVDLYGRKGSDNVFVEIETGKSDILANIEKCRALKGTVVFLFLTNELRDSWADKLPQGALAVTPADIDQILAHLH